VICALAEPRASARLLEAAVDATERSGYVDRFITAYRAVPSLMSNIAANPAWADLVRRAIAGGHDWELARRLGMKPPAGSSAERLTPRERQVLELVAAGRTNQEIAQGLCISLPTAKLHVRHILGKLGVRTRTQAAVLAANIADLGGHHGDGPHGLRFPPGESDP
jgi:DNA-binding CsgD family transcriptional regulator